MLTQAGPDADDDARDDICPCCQQKDGIRFLGSAIATLLSVTLSTLFGAEDLDAREKKALVFTDSVQDAAHRAGFVQSRSHALTLRSVLRHAVGRQPVTLDALVDQAIADAGDDPFRRYRLVPPDLADRDEFAPFWQRPTAREVPARVRDRVRRRLLFDAALEFGLQSRIGRTLEQTGSVAVEVDAGWPPGSPASPARPSPAPTARTPSTGSAADARPAARRRGSAACSSGCATQGAIDHEWFRRYIQEDGNRYSIWGGRPRGQGMPAFPRGAPAPAFPRIGRPPRQATAARPGDHAAQSWYARWTRAALGVTAADGARWPGCCSTGWPVPTCSRGHRPTAAARSIAIPASAVVVSPVDLADLRAGRHLLVCDVCRAQHAGHRRRSSTSSTAPPACWSAAPAG